MAQECDATSYAGDKPDDEAIGAQRCFDSEFVHGVDDVHGEGFESEVTPPPAMNQATKRKHRDSDMEALVRKSCGIGVSCPALTRDSETIPISVAMQMTTNQNPAGGNVTLKELRLNKNKTSLISLKISLIFSL